MLEGHNGPSYTAHALLRYGKLQSRARAYIVECRVPLFCKIPAHGLKTLQDTDKIIPVSIRESARLME